MFPRAWEKLLMGFCPTLNVALVVKQSSWSTLFQEREIRGWSPFQLLCNDLCRSFLVIFASWLTCKLPSLQQQHWHAVNGCTSGKAAVQIAAGKAYTGCHTSHVPEMAGFRVLTPMAEKKGHGHVRTSKKGFRLHLHCSRSILIEKIVWASDKKPNLLPRQTQRARYTDRPSASHPPPPHAWETIVCTRKDVGDLTLENRTVDIPSLLCGTLILFFIRYTI